MGKKVNRAKLDAALKRTALVATSGARSARSGRFLGSGPAKRTANAVIVEQFSSTAIKDIAYNPQRLELSITFASDRAYIYEGVPGDIYARLRGAESMGVFFNQHIRDMFEFRETR